MGENPAQSWIARTGCRAPGRAFDNFPPKRKGCNIDELLQNHLKNMVSLKSWADHRISELLCYVALRTILLLVHKKVKWCALATNSDSQSLFVFGLYASSWQQNL